MTGNPDGKTIVQLEAEAKKIVAWWLDTAIRWNTSATHLYVSPHAPTSVQGEDGRRREVRLQRFANWQDAQRLRCLSGAMSVEQVKGRKAVELYVWFRYDGETKSIPWPAYRNLARDNILAAITPLHWLWCPVGAHWLMLDAYVIVDKQSGSALKVPKRPESRREQGKPCGPDAWLPTWADPRCSISGGLIWSGVIIGGAIVGGLALSSAISGANPLERDL